MKQANLFWDVSVIFPVDENNREPLIRFELTYDRHPQMYL